MANFKIIPTIFAFFVISCNSSVDNKIKIKGHVMLSAAEYDSSVFESAVQILNAGGTLPQKTIDSFAQGLDTRADFYDLLVKFEKQDLFPRSYRSFQKAAESRLAGWLEYPTELDTTPSEIELLKPVELLEKDTTFIYYVFQFRTVEPHWAAKDGWMIGVVGPYFKDSHPYDWPKGIFSKFSKVSETTPEKEVAWVHKNVYQRNGY